jgi:NAD(P)-dependent dehydrogenase (short-subunit alcohol dehydrogenase family)
MTAHPRITTPFTCESTVADVLTGVNLTGKRAIVTGGAAGIGAETARALASAGAEVTLAVQNTEAAERTVAEMQLSTGNPNIRVASLDLTDRVSITSFTAAWRGPLHVLVNNAEVAAPPVLTRTLESRELQFAANHLGHFELALGLHPALATAGQARIVVVSSGGHMLSPVVFDDISFAFRLYDPGLAYGQSKTANALFAVAANARWFGDGITVNAVNPGAVTSLLQWRLEGNGRTLPVLPTLPRQAAATSVLLATSPLLEGVGGRYFEDCNEAERVTRRTDDLRGVAPYALNPENADRLWDESVDMLSD